MMQAHHSHPLLLVTGFELPTLLQKGTRASLSKPTTNANDFTSYFKIARLSSMCYSPERGSQRLTSLFSCEILSTDMFRKKYGAAVRSR